jgi:predicted transcriptional regulator
MILQSIRWRARTAAGCNARWLHLSDSMVCNYILSKGRTSSQLLQPITREIAAYLLALNSHQLQGHVDSSENPTDAASREATH